MDASLRERLDTFSAAARTLCPEMQEAVDRMVAKLAAQGAGAAAPQVGEAMPLAAAFKSEAKVHYPVLTDMDNGYALSLNLAIWVGAEVQGLMAASVRDLPRNQGNETWVLPVPASFVVDGDRHCPIPLHRPGLSQADGCRGLACGAAQCPRKGPQSMVIRPITPDRAYPLGAPGDMDKVGVRLETLGSLQGGAQLMAARARGACA